MTDPQQASFSMVKNWKHFIRGQEQDKDVHSHHSLSLDLEVPAMTIREEKACSLEKK